MENNKAYDKKYALYYDKFNESKDYGAECEFLKNIFDKYSDTKVDKILDLGCGTGLHARALSSKGYIVHGIDLSEDMVEIAKTRADDSTKFEVGDMGDFNLNEKFDACISMFSAAGYLLENEQLKSFFKSVKKHLKPNGLFVLDCWNGLCVMHELPSSRIKSSESGNLKITRRSFPKLDSLNHKCDVNFKVQVYEDNKLIDDYEEMHKVRFFFPQELKRYLESEGFEVLEICKAFELGTEVDESTWNMVLISKLKTP